jgi:hypothetical protein
VAERPPVGAVVAAPMGQTETVDVVADEAEDGGQQGERGQHGHEHAQGDAGGQPADHVQAEGEQAQDGDDHGGAGEQDGPPGGVDRPHGGLLGRQPGLEAFAVAGDDEQGVVDAHADADHQHGLVGEAGHVDQVDGQADQADAGADAEQGGQQGQAHGQDRPEGQQQDHHGGQEPQALAARGALVGEGVAAQLDLQPGRLDLVDQVAGGLAGLPVCRGAALAQVELGVGDPRVALGALAAALWGVGAHHLAVGDVGLQLGEQRRHRLADGGIVDALVGPEHDLAAGTGLGPEPVGAEQVGGLLALGARQGEVVGELTTGARVEHDQAGQEQDPAGQDAAAAAVHGAGETLEHGTSRFDEGRPRVARSGIAGNAREPARRCRPPPVGGRLHPQGQGSGGRLPHREDVPTPAGG